MMMGTWRENLILFVANSYIKKIVVVIATKVGSSLVKTSWIL
jgi:hypothetical protein